jgi:hypothetical protein
MLCLCGNTALQLAMQVFLPENTDDFELKKLYISEILRSSWPQCNATLGDLLLSPR